MLFSFTVFGQLEIPFFEQIAFDFYKDSILSIYPLERKIKVFRYTIDSHPTEHKFVVQNCLTGRTLAEGEELQLFSTYLLQQNDWDAPNFELKYSTLDKSLFKIKNRAVQGHPKLLISAPHFEKDKVEVVYLNIIEDHKNFDTVYHLKINIEGEVLNWCRTETETIIIK